MITLVVLYPSRFPILTLWLFGIIANWYAGFTMIDLAKQPPHIQQRYGYREVNSKSQIAVLAIITVIIAGAAAMYFNHRAQSTTFSLTSFVVTSDKTVDMTWQIARPENQVTYCVVRAQNDQRSDVGYSTVTIPAGPTVADFTYTLNTESKAVLAEVLGCGATTQLRVPTPNFPPGAKIPAQDPPGVAPTLQ